MDAAAVAAEQSDALIDEMVSNGMDSDDAPMADMLDGGAARRAARRAAAASGTTPLASGGLPVPAAAGGSDNAAAPPDRLIASAKASAEPRRVTDVSGSAKEV